MAGRGLPSPSTDRPRVSKSNGGMRRSSGYMKRADGRRRSMASGKIGSGGCLEGGVCVVDTTVSSDCDDEMVISAASSTSTDNDGDSWQTSDGESGQISESPSDNTQTQKIMDMLEKEVGIYLKSKESVLQCPICPFRMFPRPCRVRIHVAMYHSERYDFCPSWKKQLVTCRALYDGDKLKCEGFSTTPSNYLRTPASIMREGVIGNRLSTARSAIHRRWGEADKLIRIAHYASGPVFRHVDSDSPSIRKFRQVGYGFYSECFHG